MNSNDSTVTGNSIGLGEKKTIRIKTKLNFYFHLSGNWTFKNWRFSVLSSICFGLPFQPSDEHTNRGVDFMVEAAEAGDRGAMVYMGRAFETGDGLGTLR